MLKSNKKRKAKIVGIIPARGGSKSIPGKNIKLLGGRPLIAYSIMASKLSRDIQRTIVSTDSEEIREVALRYGAEAPFLRPAEISRDNSSDYEWVKHALDWMRDNEGHQPEYLVHLRPTTPFRETSYIEAAIEAIKKDKKATALRSLHEMPQSSYKTFEIEGRYLKSVYSASFDIEASNRPRQMFKTTYDANGYVDIIRTNHVIKNKKVHGDRVIAYITPHVFEVDAPGDFEYLEYLVSKNPILVKRLFK